MTPQVSNALDSFVAEAKKLYQTNLKQVILFGSYARGEEEENSDVDLFLVVSLSDKQVELYDNRICDISYDVGYEDNLNIQPFVTSEEHFEKWKGVIPLYKNVSKEGVVLYG